MRIPSLALFTTLVAISSIAAAQDNELTASERADGWELLFDGKSLKGWRGYANAPITGWEVRDGTLHAMAKTTGVNLVTERTFSDFEFTWAWKLPPAGNNGVKYFVTEARPSAPGHEYQMIDDVNNSDAKRSPLQQTAAFYDVLPAAANKPSKAIGDWNVSKIVVRGRKVEHWLNNQKVLTYELGSKDVKAGLAKSKFANEPGFGDKIVGHLMLTYHNDDCWYRNLKVRPLE